MKLCKKIVGIALLSIIIFALISGTALAAYTYYATVQVQETESEDYSYLPIIAEVDNDYLASNGYISLTGLDTRITSGSTELEHMVADDKVLFVAPSIEADSISNYRYTLGNSLLSSFPIITGQGGYITSLDDPDMELGATFTSETRGYVNTGAGNFKEIIHKPLSFKTYVSGATNIRSAILTGGASASVAAASGGNNAVNSMSHTITLPAGVASGDLLLVLFASDNIPTITFPAGWTLLSSKDVTASTARVVIYYRIADGTEGISIVVATSLNEMTAYSAYRITGYSGIPVIGTWATANTNTPDPPSLTAPWGNANNLWIAITGYDVGTLTVGGYPLLSDNRNDRSNNAEGVGLGICNQQIAAASVDPGVFNLSAPTDTATATIVVAPSETESLAVTATGVPSGICKVVTTATGGAGSLTISVYDEDNVLIDDDTIAMGGGSCPDNNSGWMFVRNNVMPYMEYYKHTVGATLIAWYQPISMIIGTNLDDREGTDLGETGTGEEDGVIVWGTNPALDITVGSLVSSGQPTPAPASEEETPDIVPPDRAPSGGTVNTVKLESSPLYPIVKLTSENTGFTEEQIWFSLATFAIVIGMGISAVRVPNHMLLAGTVGIVLAGFFTSMRIYQPWMMLIFGFMFIVSILMERKPVF